MDGRRRAPTFYSTSLNTISSIHNDFVLPKLVNLLEDFLVLVRRTLQYDPLGKTLFLVYRVIVQDNSKIATKYRFGGVIRLMRVSAIMNRRMDGGKWSRKWERLHSKD